ncbi:MAG TPA: hypothetical protein VGD14_02610 [bacterium]
MMEDELINHFLKKHQESFDRFTFDEVFRFLLSQDFNAEQAKDIILNHCQLSPLVAQERIENGFYREISTEEEISSDLRQLIDDAHTEYWRAEIERIINLT